jgi:predicted aspartyl protease
MALLVDTGADRTVFSALDLTALGLSPVPTDERIGGLGGLVDSIAVETTIRLRQTRGAAVTFRGQFAAVLEPEALDMSVLGRDISGLFAVIVDQPGNTVCLVGQRHRYAIFER